MVARYGNSVGVSDHREVTYVNRSLLVEVMVVATFILVLLMMFGVRFGG